MPYDPSQHHRQSIRLHTFDYSQPGAYFVTLVTQGRTLLFDDPVLLRVAETLWQRIPRHHTNVALDAWVVMPNHLHGILLLHGTSAGLLRVEDELPSTDVIPAGTSERGTVSVPPAGGSSSVLLGTIVGNFKAVVTRRINLIRKTPGGAVWQRNYYERVIRNERELEAVREYIRNNPLNWELDQENPGR